MLKDAINILADHLEWQYVVIIMLVMSAIEVSPLKLDPWTAIRNFFSNRNVLDELNVILDKIKTISTNVDALNDRVIQLEIANERNVVINCRIRILRFGDEILHNEQHTKEHFEQTLSDIDFYENYCIQHPDFKNQITTMNVRIIKEQYEKCLKGESQFLPYHVNKSEEKEG